MNQLAETRKRAEVQAKQLLGLDHLTVVELFGLAEATLGASRAGRCLELSRGVRLTRRWAATESVAELIVRTRSLGSDWWMRNHEEMISAHNWRNRGTPDAFLVAGTPSLAESCLDSLGNWIADDAADAKWGRPIDFVDLNDPGADDRFELPKAARQGDRLVAAFDSGGRVWAEVVRRDESQEPAGNNPVSGRAGLGSVLMEHRYVDVAEVGWAWGLAINVGPIHLPGEARGGIGDPFGELLDAGTAHRLYAWAAEHDASASLGNSWSTKANLWSAYFRLGLPYLRNGDWFYFERAIRAAIDGDKPTLNDALGKLPK